MGENISILLVDDHLAARESLALILRHQENMEIIGEASNGRMAIELTRELQPDVIIMDVSMPVLNGIEATRQISSNHPNAKVIGFTMNPETNLAYAMQKAGAIACISKGDPIEVLLETIQKCAPVQ
jgi:two-component system, NarL family, response regulator NreC